MNEETQADVSQLTRYHDIMDVSVGGEGWEDSPTTSSPVVSRDGIVDGQWALPKYCIGKSGLQKCCTLWSPMQVASKTLACLYQGNVPAPYGINHH